MWGLSDGVPGLRRHFCHLGDALPHSKDRACRVDAGFNTKLGPSSTSITSRCTRAGGSTEQKVICLDAEGVALPVAEDGASFLQARWDGTQESL